MYRSGIYVTLRFIDVTEKGACCCECCNSELATGDRGLVAFRDGQWFMVFRAHTCDYCADDTWVPVLCTPAMANRVAQEIAELMEENFHEFYLAPFENEPRASYH